MKRQCYINSIIMSQIENLHKQGRTIREWRMYEGINATMWTDQVTLTEIFINKNCIKQPYFKSPVYLNKRFVSQLWIIYLTDFMISFDCGKSDKNQRNMNIFYYRIIKSQLTNRLKSLGKTYNGSKWLIDARLQINKRCWMCLKSTYRFRTFLIFFTNSIKL